MSGPGSDPSDDSRRTSDEDVDYSESRDPTDDSSSNRDRSDTADREMGKQSDRGSGQDSPQSGTDDTEPLPGDRPGERVSRPSAQSDPGANERVRVEDVGYIRWFFRTKDSRVVAVRDILSSAAVVIVIALILFGISGLWPPLVAVESGSMEPNMNRGDLIFVVHENRFVGDGSIDETGIVTLENGHDSGHDKFGKHGDVIVFSPNGNDARTPVIHRAHFWVNAGENWVETKANADYLNGASCEDLSSCPAQHDGFVTKGDANPGYDQAGSGARTDVVKSEWVSGKGMLRIPWLGHVRLTFDRLFFTGPGVTGLSVVGGIGLLGAVVARRNGRSGL